MCVRFLRQALLMTMLAAAVACSKSSSQESTSAGQNLIPAPTGTLSNRDLAQRFRGQTEFVSLSPFSRVMFEGRARSAAMEAAPKAAGGERRDVQESDIYKLGPAGAKILFLLNDYRGLQAVSFAKGADVPDMLARVPATGNYPNQMYYDQANERLIVLENLWKRDSYLSEMQSRLLVYDVRGIASGKKPAVVQTVDVTGVIADSRMVGNVLYLATSVEPTSRTNWDGSRNTPKGMVISYSVAAGAVKEIVKHEMALPTVSGEMMNIVEVEEAGKYKYYLVAVQSETGWSWFGRNAMVEVVDITDATGKIAPVMQVSVKGTIERRGQTLIKDDTLIVTSNYMSERMGTNNRPIARVAVETFRFPARDSKVISEKEANYRKVVIDHELGDKTDEARDEALKTLVIDARVGIKGVFVKTETGLRKMMSDSVATTGDTTGLSASLQDVRYQNGLLYAFWVPANMVDPLDIFDISKPQEGVKFLSRLTFEGWISRAEPITLNGRTFILGLGHIIPVSDERGNRRLQATIFEVKKIGSIMKAEQMAQLTLDGAKYFTSFNVPDKYIVPRFTEDGKGEVLFAASRYDASKYESGGKLINFDVNQVVSGNPEKALTEGAFLAGDSSWVKRVFTNTEIDRINVFSNTLLGIFDSKRMIGDVARTTAMLELARDIRGYETVKSGSETVGVQIVSMGNAWYSLLGATTELRLVDTKNPDAELPAMITGAFELRSNDDKRISLKGSYLSHLQVDQSIYVLTNEYKSEKRNEEYIYTTTYRLSVVNATTGKTLRREEATWSSERGGRRRGPAGRMIMPWRMYTEAKMFRLPSGDIVINTDEGAMVVDKSSPTAAPKSMTLSANCKPSDKASTTATLLGDQLFIESAIDIEQTELQTRLQKKYVAKATLAGTAVTCEKAVNIPGELIAITADGSYMTKDTWARNFQRYEDSNRVTSYQVETEAGVTGLTVKDAKATLRDQLKETASVEPIRLLDGRVVLVQQLESNEDSFGISPWRRGRRVSSDARLEVIYLNAVKGELTSQVSRVEVASGAYSSLVSVKRWDAKSHLALVSGAAGIQLLSIPEDSKEPVTSVKMAQILDGVESKDKVEVLNAHTWSGSALHISPESKTIELSLGMNGIVQARIEK